MSRYGFVISPETLYCVATPVGHLGDISFRALDTLEQVDWIAAEDTRHSQKLLQHYQIKTRCVPVHQHNEQKQSLWLIDVLNKGQSVALISDAGTPAISDPGAVVVQNVVDAGFDVVPIPGASAVSSALSVAGALSVAPWTFYGFLPAKPGQRKKLLTDILPRSESMIFFETPHRIVAMMADLRDILGDGRLVVVAKEISKLHEQMYRGTLAEACAWLDSLSTVKGEFVVIVAGCDEPVEMGVDADIEAVLTGLLGSMSTKQASEILARVSGVQKKQLYQAAIAIKNHSN